jgi:medium-chain acyl-[acyl-carrier-protein] hydrolase
MTAMAGVETRRNAWIPMAAVTSNANVRLFCLPYAGGGTAVYKPWMHLAPSTLQVCPIQLPGREHRLSEPAFTRMDALLDAMIEGIGTYLDRPFAIFGHSMGALLAFELARALRRRGMPQPVHLFLSGHRAPQLPDRRPPIHQLDDDEFWSALRRLGGTPDEVLEHRELMDLVAPTLRADFALCETYPWTAEAPLDIPLSLFGGTDDPNVDQDELEAWRETTQAPVSVRMFAGNHLYLLKSQREVFEAVLRVSFP